MSASPAADEVWRTMAALVIDNRDSWKRAVVERTGLSFSRIRILNRLAKRPMTVQDLLRHTSGLTYEHQGDGPVHKIYQDSRVRSRKITNAEHAALVASFPLVCHPVDMK